MLKNNIYNKNSGCRRALEKDIDAIIKIRLLVNENILSDPSKITKQICIDYLDKLGRGWVYEIEGQVVGFSYAAHQDNSIWALFVRPDVEGQGIGKELLKQAYEWLFSIGAEKVFLETGANTRADRFYNSQGWKRGNVSETGEVDYILHKDKVDA